MYRKWSIKPPLSNKPPLEKAPTPKTDFDNGAYSNFQGKRLFSVYGQKEHYIRPLKKAPTLELTWINKPPLSNKPPL